MAKVRSELNRSEAIRQAYKVLPEARAKEIVAHLKGKGIEVTDGLVYQVKKVSKRRMKLNRKAARVPHVKSMAATPAKSVAVSSNGRLGVGASIAVAKSAAEKVGGWAALKEIVDALA